MGGGPNRKKRLIKTGTKKRMYNNHEDNISSNTSNTINMVLDLETDESESVDRPLTIVHQLLSLQIFTNSLRS